MDHDPDISPFVATLKGFRTKQGNIGDITIIAGNTGYKGMGKGTPRRRAR